MKTMTKLFTLFAVGLAMAGCAPSDDSKITLDDSGKKVSEGHAPPGAPKSSKEAYERGKNQNDMLRNKDYSGAGR